MNKRFPLVIGLVTLFAFPAQAVEPALFHLQIDRTDKEKLQRGARFFMNHCSGCHALKYLRYNRMALDLGLTTFDGALDEELLVNNLIFTQSKPQETISVAMPESDSRQWFGIVPPDLSLTTRVRGSDWIYTYLKSFYEDSSRPFGSNNLLVPQVAMPNILEPLIGRVVAVKNPDLKHNQDALTLLPLTKGEMSEQQLNSALEDLVTFLAYASEPVQATRHRMGYFVLAYLLVLLAVLYPLKKLYWKKL